MDESQGHEVAQSLEQALGTVILGKPRAVRLVVTGLLADGHVLIEDVPGVGKTMLVRALSNAIQGQFRRIQFTPDLLPGDVTGTHVYNQDTGEFSFEPGPAFTEILLADEINRATPRTQSALLECMEERQITVDGEQFELPDAFFTAATQNPVEQQGTFPLPEAQLDRFLLKFSLGYPSAEVERDISSINRRSHPVHDVEPVCKPEHVVYLQKLVKDVYVSESVRQYIVELVRGTREHDAVELGASPRGSIAVRRASQAYAFCEGRDYISPDDVQALLEPTLVHRIVLDPQEKMSGVGPETVLRDVREGVQVPTDFEPAQ